MQLVRVEEAIRDIKRGKMVIVIDDEDRENEGDLVMAAEKVTPEAINFMAKYGRGLICAPLTRERLEELKIPDMVSENTSNFGTAFTISVDAKKGTTTGISAYDRAKTIKVLISKKSKPNDLVRPGHIFPLKAKEGGVLTRAGQTEAGVDLSKLAGLYPASIVCEIMKEDGTMARLPYLIKFAKKHKLKIVTVADIIQYRLKTEMLVNRILETKLPTEHGQFRLILYGTTINDQLNLALVMGDINENDEVLVRVHSECLTGDVLGSLRCDCGFQLKCAMSMIAKEKKGILLYLPQEGRGIGLVNKLKAYALQDNGRDTVDANIELGFSPDLRDYGIGAQILVNLGVKKIKLLTNNPRKIVGLEGYGLKVIKRVPIQIKATSENIKYLKTKQKRLGHFLNY